MLDGGDSGNARCNGNGGAAIELQCSGGHDAAASKGAKCEMSFEYQSLQTRCSRADRGRRLRVEVRGSRVEGGRGLSEGEKVRSG